ncbi:hypothetical protein U0070_008444, partial [Myodes glareolus]
MCTRLYGQLGYDGSSSGGNSSGQRQRLLIIILGLGIRAGGLGPQMRLVAGWLCLSLAFVWLAQRMWTLRSLLSSSLTNAGQGVDPDQERRGPGFPSSVVDEMEAVSTYTGKSEKPRSSKFLQLKCVKLLLSNGFLSILIASSPSEDQPRILRRTLKKDPISVTFAVLLVVTWQQHHLLGSWTGEFDAVMEQLRVAIITVNSTRVDAGMAEGLSSWISAAMNHLKEW